MTSKRQLRRRECGSKVRYATQPEAEAEIRGRHLHPYKCPWCGKFHLGHMTGKTKRATGYGWGG